MYLPDALETGEWVISGFERALQRRVLEGRRKKLQIRAADESCGRKICAVNRQAQTVKVNVKVKQGHRVPVALAALEAAHTRT